MSSSGPGQRAELSAAILDPQTFDRARREAAQTCPSAAKVKRGGEDACETRRCAELS